MIRSGWTVDLCAGRRRTAKLGAPALTILLMLLLHGLGSGCAPAVREIPPDQPSPVPLRDIRALDGGSITTLPRLVQYTQPEYPQEAIFDGVTGTVILKAEVNERGEVDRVDVLRSLPIFDVPCIEAMQTWRFSPALRDGAPVAFTVSVPFAFMVR